MAMSDVEGSVTILWIKDNQGRTVYRVEVEGLHLVVLFFAVMILIGSAT